MTSHFPAVEPRLSRPAVLSLGVCALLIGVVIAPMLPWVVLGVCCWWLYDDLGRDPISRPGWLGVVALVVFSLVAVAMTTLFTVVMTNADCGANVFGGYDPGPSTFDRACADAQRWRSVVGVTLALVVCGLAAVGVRRSDPGQARGAVVARTFGVSTIAIIAINVVVTVI